MARVGGDPRNAKYSLKLRARSAGDANAIGGSAIEVGAKLAHDVESFVDTLNRQRTDIIFSPLNRDGSFVGDVVFLDAGRMAIGGDAVYETPEFPGTLVAKAHAGRWLLWLRLTARAPAAGGSGGIALGDLSLLCRFVDYPATPSGPDHASIGESSRFTTRSADNHGGSIEYRWISLRFFESLWERGVIEQDWSARNVLVKTWSTPGLYDILVQARSAADPEISNTTPRGLIVLVAPMPPEAIRYPLANDTGDYGVAWSESGGATRYDAERSTDGGASWTWVYSGAATSFEERVGEGRYRYRVRACAPADAGTENCSGWLEGEADGVVEFGGAPSAPPASVAGFVEQLRLRSKPACGGEGAATVLGELSRAGESSDEVDFAWAGAEPFPLPPGSEACFEVTCDLSPHAPVGELLQFFAAALAVLLVEARSHGRLEPRSRPLRRAAGALAAFLFSAALLTPAGGCGGGGGGAGAPVAGKSREIQLGLLEADDLKLSGVATGTGAGIEGLPEGGLRGPRNGRP